MSKKHPVVVVTGSSGAGTSTVKKALESIFHRHKINPALIEGDSFHRYDREDMRREMGLSDDFEPHYLNVEGTQEVFDTKRSRSIVLISLIRLGYADGAFEVEEQSYLNTLCSVFEISNDDFVLIENWVRRLIALEREANAFL